MSSALHFSPSCSTDTSSGTQNLPPFSDNDSPRTIATSESNAMSISSEETPPKQYPTGGPPVKYPYNPEDALEDLPGVSFALEQFLMSRMLESEEYYDRNDKKKERLYFATGYGVIQCVKGLMSYEDNDLQTGITHTKHAYQIANQHRKKASFLGSRLAGYVLGTGGVSFIKSMTHVERHAELTYAESLFGNALLGIVYSGDWLAFIKEALNMRTIIGIYRQLGQFLDAVDAEAMARGEGPEDNAIDEHFRSGVYLGVGLCNIILSLMPGKLLTFVELFGYHGNRKLGLATLLRAGGWSHDAEEPSIDAAHEGVRRSICDMALLIFHLVLSSFTFDGVDISLARKILSWNLRRYPNGVFFLFGAGRLCICRSQPKRAIEYYTQAMNSQKQYRNLHHISSWEIAIANLALWDLPASLACWRQLEAEATWSKAMYTYGMAVCLLEIGGDKEDMKEVEALMAKVSGLRQKIAGKSIPIEKFIARKARKFALQGNRLALPALELAYLFMGITHAPRAVITGKMLPVVDALLAKLEQHMEDPNLYGGGQGHWDDFCLSKFLQGVCLRYVAYPDPDAELDPNDVISMQMEEAEQAAAAAFKCVFEHGPKIEYDHHLVYHAHYELGRLLACQGDEQGARHQFELVLSGKPLEVGASGRKIKYSMENALHMRTHAANEALHGKRL